MFSSKIEIKGPQKLIRAYHDALVPESDSDTERANYKLKLGEGRLIIKVTAKDATAFRAITTSLTGLISIVDKSIKNIKG